MKYVAMGFSILLLVFVLWNVRHLDMANHNIAALEQRVEALEQRAESALVIESQRVGLVGCPWGTEPFTSTDGIHGGYFLGCR